MTEYNDIDPIKGMAWYNNLSQSERKFWLEQTNDYVPAQAYKVYLNYKEFGASSKNQSPYNLT